MRAHQLGVTASVQEDVFGLDVPVDDPPGVKVGQGLQHARHVEATAGVLETTPDATTTTTFQRRKGKRKRSGPVDKKWETKGTPDGGPRLFLRSVHSSPPRHASISMYTYLLSLKVRYNLHTRARFASIWQGGFPFYFVGAPASLPDHKAAARPAHDDLLRARLVFLPRRSQMTFLHDFHGERPRPLALQLHL